MIQYSLLGRTAASIRLNTTFRGLAPSPSSGKTMYLYDFCSLMLGSKLFYIQYILLGVFIVLDKPCLLGSNYFKVGHSVHS
jgi:hypothetical protein